MIDPVEAIAHEGRRTMLRLVVSQECSVGELADAARLSQPAASQHLKILRDAGLVTVRADGPRRLYRVDPDGLEVLRAELDAFWGPALESLRTASEEMEKDR